MATESTSVKAAAGLVRASRAAYARKGVFLALAAWVFFVSAGIAGKLDLLPNPLPEVAVDEDALAAAPIEAATVPELPTRIEIPAIGLSETVANPNSTDVAVLDRALLAGPVRYPSSSKLGEAGNVIIFGHSSYLPIVNNKAFKSFNGIQKLKEGDRITVTGDGHVFVYAVQTVTQESALSDSIPLGGDEPVLTLATCDSFGEKTDRFVVTAALVETRALQ